MEADVGRERFIDHPGNWWSPQCEFIMCVSIVDLAKFRFVLHVRDYTKVGNRKNTGSSCHMTSAPSTGVISSDRHRIIVSLTPYTLPSYNVPDNEIFAGARATGASVSEPSTSVRYSINICILVRSQLPEIICHEES